MALLHKKGWLLDKKPVQLALGYHYDQHVRSIAVLKGTRVPTGKRGKQINGVTT